jgi:hypothetical protein
MLIPSRPGSLEPADFVVITPVTTLARVPADLNRLGNDAADQGGESATAAAADDAPALIGR